MQKQTIVWMIDKQHWPRACVRAELIERGFDAVGFEEIYHALYTLNHASAPTPSIIVLEAQELPVTKFELDRLAGFRIPLIALTGNLAAPDPSFYDVPWAAILKRPFTVGEVCDLVAKVISERSKGAKEGF